MKISYNKFTALSEVLDLNSLDNNKKLMIMKLLVISILLMINLSNCFDDHKFATELYMQIKEESKSLIYSPMSVQTALSLVMFGATGETKQEMKNALHYENSNDEEIQQKYMIQSEKVDASKYLKIAIKIYVAEEHAINETFNDMAMKVFHSEAQNVDFNKKQETADMINKWVEDQTNNKIKNLISPKLLVNHTKMILINAIHFKGSWINRFYEKETNKSQFFLNNENSVDVDMMSQRVSFILCVEYYLIWNESPRDRTFLCMVRVAN